MPIDDKYLGCVWQVTEVHDTPRYKNFYSENCLVLFSTMNTKLVHLPVKGKGCTTHYWVECLQLSGMGAA